jgi:UDP-N-acetylglucosamine:LPS N-acetylglucosamine transferase
MKVGGSDDSEGIPGRHALLLSGSLGMGHDVMAEACADSLRSRGWGTRTADSLRMMGGRAGSAGQNVFRGLVALPGVYDAYHFSQLRTGGRLASATDAAASRFLVPRLRDELEQERADLVVSVFATGASAASRVKPQFPGLVTAVFCTDVCPHRLWVHENTDLYMVTSATAARYVRRFDPCGRIAVVPTPVRGQFYDAPTQEDARAELGIPVWDRCVLLMSGSWGLGPLVDCAKALAEAGVWVIAVAGRNEKLAGQLRSLARSVPRIVPVGFATNVPTLMSAADLVVTSSGDTCSEARVIGRDLLLLDVIPGHGRDNLQHELERGRAEVSAVDARPLVRNALACLDRVKPPSVRVEGTPQAWERAFSVALGEVGLGDLAIAPGG